MNITYTNVPLPGEHNDGQIWVRWELEVGDSKVRGFAPDREAAEEAVRKQVESYAKHHGKFDWITFHKLHSAVAIDKRSRA